MAEDPSIAFHRTKQSEFKFELSGLRTGSVRDQIIRAYQLVHALARAGTIAPDKPLLILGGGAAGASACLTACQLRVDSCVVEKESSPFSTQIRAGVRRIGPVEYDWPQPFWRRGSIDWDGGSYPLPFDAGPADHVASQWANYFYAVRNLPSRPADIDLYTSLDASRLTIRDTLIGAKVTFPGGATREFGAVISCIGFAGELTAIQAQSGTMTTAPFWGPDDLLQLQAGASNCSGQIAEVLISGGGDGAQQDFLRAATKLFGWELFDALKLDERDPAWQRLALADDVGRRAHAWSSPGSRLPDALERWHAEYEAVADGCWQKWQSTGALNELAQVLRPDTRVTWLWGKPYLGYSYGLNRILSILISRLIAFADGRPWKERVVRPAVVLTQSRMTNVEGLRHPRCDAACHSSGHKVFDATGKLLGVFDVVVVRHGVDQKPFFEGGAAVVEQIGPLQIPG